VLIISFIFVTSISHSQLQQYIYSRRQSFRLWQCTGSHRWCYHQPPYQALIPGAPYASGRFSNGNVWVESFASSLGLFVTPSLLGGTNFAFGGARTGSLTGVTDSFSPSLSLQRDALVGSLGTLPSDALYVVWGGGNDIREAATVANPNAVISDSLNNITSIIASLQMAGATDFLVPNLPNIGLTPAATALGPAAIAGLSQLSSGFNMGLTSVVAGLEANLGINIIDLDIESLVNDAVTSPNNFGFSNVSNACIILGGGSCSSPDSYLFWDGIHPTTAAHLIIADAAHAAVTPVPSPSTLPLLVFGLLLLVASSPRYISNVNLNTNIAKSS
jgi:outer membrane lipase/esterase